jgi:tetratricopeptide (TPR) repeat protein
LARARDASAVEVPDDVYPSDLEPEIRMQLRSLSRPTADAAARHLVMAGRLLADDPGQALAHARAARARGARIGVIREAVGVAAYYAEEYAEALSELRAARRMTGAVDYQPMMADCERALGRPDRAIEMLRSADAERLDDVGRIELLIVAAGARRDLGESAAAAAMLRVPGLRPPRVTEVTARLRYAYADALVAAGRTDEAREWFELAAEADPDGGTGAAERLLELDGVLLEDGDVEEDDESGAGGVGGPGAGTGTGTEAEGRDGCGQPRG